MSENASHASGCLSPSSSCSLVLSEEAHLDRHARLKKFLMRFVLLPFLQGVMLGLGQHGARYFLSYVARRKVISFTKVETTSSSDHSSPPLD